MVKEYTIVYTMLYFEVLWSIMLYMVVIQNYGTIFFCKATFKT